MDLKEPFKLPSKGKIYSREIEENYTIRAPRLKEKGIGDLRKKNKIQAEVLKKCLEPTPELDPYDWHVSDFTAANLAQRVAARGKDMRLNVTCPKCKFTEEITIDLSKLENTKPKLPLDLTYTDKEGRVIKLRFLTPRILDSIKDNTAEYKEQYPEADWDVSLQETCRALIVDVDGEKLTYSQMTNFIIESYEVDLLGMIDKVVSNGFGPSLIQKRPCSNCKNEIVFTISPDQG